MSQETQQQTGWWEILKRIFFAIIFMQVIFSMVPAMKKGFEEATSTKTKVAKINVEGNIMTSTTWIKEIRHAIANPEAKAILLKINSGGGAAGTSELVHREILRAKKIKPVVALVESVCASGAYCIASAANTIIAQSMSLVGSIGVASGFPKLKKLINYHNVEMETMYSGKYKSMTQPFEEKMTPEQKAHWQTALDGTYSSFVSLVNTQRPQLPIASHDKWADAQIFSGDKALLIGLIDQIGDLGSAEDEIRKLTEISGTEIEFVSYPKKSPLAKMLAGQEGGEEDNPQGLPQSLVQMVVESLCSYFSSHNSPGIELK